MSTWDDRFEHRPVKTSMFLIVGIVAFVLVLGWAIMALTFGLRVATAGIVGRGEAHIIKESAPNRIIQQAGFEQAWADIRMFDQQVKDAGVAVTAWDAANGAKPDNALGTLANQRAYLVQTQTGLRQQCQRTVEQYNADARKYLAHDFRAADLPMEIDLASHCK